MGYDIKAFTKDVRKASKVPHHIPFDKAVRFLSDWVSENESTFPDEPLDLKDHVSEAAQEYADFCHDEFVYANQVIGDIVDYYDAY